ncbi:MAG: hypothetical protein U0L98_02755 [Clostridia bacterium]|nr:hypothetical protein [Clostridia bacterium]
MNTTHLLSDLADELNMKIPPNGSNSFEGQKSSDVTDYFFAWIVNLFRDDGNPSVTVTVVDMLPNLLLFFSTNGNHTKIYTPYPDSMYRIFVYEVACIFDRHPNFSSRIGENRVGEI